MKKKKQNKFPTFGVGVWRIISKIRECMAVKYIKSSVCYSMTAPILKQPLRASGIFCSETNEIQYRYTELHVPLTESIHLKTVFF
jgi:hypothetical protein